MFTSFNGEFTNETLGVKCDHSRYDVRPVNLIASPIDGRDWTQLLY